MEALPGGMADRGRSGASVGCFWTARLEEEKRCATAGENRLPGDGKSYGER